MDPFQSTGISNIQALSPRVLTVICLWGALLNSLLMLYVPLCAVTLLWAHLGTQYYITKEFLLVL